jgi:alcohol dehydrogenase (NADP+)
MKGEAKGQKSYGGYANYNRCPGHFVVKIPEGLDPALAAPMLCEFPLSVGFRLERGG